MLCGWHRGTLSQRESTSIAMERLSRRFSIGARTSAVISSWLLIMVIDCYPHFHRFQLSFHEHSLHNLTDVVRKLLHYWQSAENPILMEAKHEMKSIKQSILILFLSKRSPTKKQRPPRPLLSQSLRSRILSSQPFGYSEAPSTCTKSGLHLCTGLRLE